MVRSLLILLAALGTATGATYKTPDGKTLSPVSPLVSYPLIEFKGIKIHQCKAQGDPDLWLLIQITAVHHLRRSNPTDIYATLQFTAGGSPLGEGTYTLWAERPAAEKPFTMSLVARSFALADRVTPLPVTVTFDYKPWVPPEKRPKAGE